MGDAAGVQHRQFLQGCLSMPLRLLVFMALLAGPRGYLVGVENGLLAEYFLSLKDTCVGANGSLDVLDGRPPNFTRVDGAVNFHDRLAFNIKRCVWERNNFGQLKYVCRASDETTMHFAARWTGYLYVKKEGMYTFKMASDDGARLLIGNSQCPGAMCGSWEDVMNAKLGSWSGWRDTLQRDAFAKYCPLCESGVYGDCWVSNNGCEPFRQWWLETDGGNSGTCSNGERFAEGSRWLPIGMHPIRIEYFQRGGKGKLTLEYKGPDADSIGANGGFVPISARNFIFPQFKGLRADWFETPRDMIRLPPQSDLGTVPGKFIRTMDDDFIAHGPGQGWFSQQLFDADKPTMVRWSGFMKIDTPGLYTFELYCDDGGRFILAGRGGEREQILIDNDGVQARAKRTSVSKAMMAGLHGIRIDYFYLPGYVGSVPTPPGIELSYRGPDTGDIMRPMASTGGGSVLQKNDATCQMRNWAWGKGLSISRDCQGRCADTNEAVVGDGICDQGILMLGARTLDVRCAAYNYDNSDCEARVYPVETTPRPRVTCYESCPAGAYFRNNCRSCPSGRALDDGKNELCLSTTARLCTPPADQPDACTNLQCCVAHISGLEGWGGDCMAFGTATNCSHQLAIILASLREEPMDLYSQGFYKPFVNPRPQKYAYLLKNNVPTMTNSIPTDMVVNPRTGLDTDQPVCPVGESNAGISCFEGPWYVTDVSIPRDECEGGPGNGKYHYNFCKNTKTLEGKPFVKCCAFAYQNALGKGECRFAGLPYGSCLGYIEALKESLGRSQWTRISMTTVLNDCDQEDCNDPEDVVTGCPHVVNKAPKETADTNTPPPGYINKTEMLQGASEGEGDGPPWLIMGLIAGCIFGLILACVVTNHLLKEPPFSPWYSNKAHVVSDDTWIEPAQDEQGGEYGVIAPRQPAFNMLVKQQKEKDGHSFGPKALEDGGAISTSPEVQAAFEAAVTQENLRRLAALANQNDHPQHVGANRRSSTKGSRASRLSLMNPTLSHRASVTSAVPGRSSIASSGFGTPLPGSVAGDGALALEDVAEDESEAPTESEAYDGIFMPHMVEVRLNQVNPASLSRPAAADRYNRGGINSKPMIQTICT